MSDQLPSQAEGERDDEEEEEDVTNEATGGSGRPGSHRVPRGHPSPRQTPSQAEGERMDDPD